MARQNFQSYHHIQSYQSKHNRASLSVVETLGKGDCVCVQLCLAGTMASVLISKVFLPYLIFIDVLTVKGGGGDHRFTG